MPSDTMKSAAMRRLAVSLHLEHGQSLETTAHNTCMSRRTLTRLLEYVEDTREVHYAPARCKTHADSILKCPDLRSSVLCAVEQCPEELVDAVSDCFTDLHELLREHASISLSSVSRILSANGLTRKVIDLLSLRRTSLNARPGS